MPDKNQLPPLNWLKSFEACARLGSYTAAADELNITQPAVSHQIRLLEIYLGRKLFLRDGRRKKLSEAGHDYIFFVREAFDILRVGSKTIFETNRGSELTLRVNMAFALFWLIPRLDDLYKKYPWITLNILPHISDIDLGQSNFEFEIINSINFSPNDYRPLRDEYFFPVASPKLIETDVLTKSHLFDTTSMTPNWDAWFNSGFKGPQPSAVNYSSTVVVSLTAAINGIGLALAHTSIYEVPHATGQLVRPYSGQIKMRERYFISLIPKAQYTPASRTFMEWLEEQIERE